MANKPYHLERLQHISEAIDKIFAFTEDISYADFHQDEMRQLAVIKLFEIIGEASYKLNNTFKSAHPEIEWSKMEGLRHVLVHDYYRIEPEILWNTKELFLEDLGLAIDALLKTEKEI